MWHLSITPCFDKKLEASREDFAKNGVPDVDGVVASKGYLHHLMNISARNLFELMSIPQKGGGVQIRTIRNQDMVEYTLLENRQLHLQMARCYGFRNPQYLVGKIERQKT